MSETPEPGESLSHGQRVALIAVIVVLCLGAGVVVLVKVLEAYGLSVSFSLNLHKP